MISPRWPRGDAGIGGKLYYACRAITSERGVGNERKHILWNRMASCEARPTSSASSSAASQGSAALPIPEAYVETKAAVSFSDGSSATDASVYDERGRLQRGSFEEVSPEAASKVDQSFSEWDEYGHVLKGEYGYDPGDGKPYTASTSLQVLEANEDGSVVSVAQTITYDKESFEEGDAASATWTDTFEYGDDAQVIRKHEAKAEYYDQSGARLGTRMETYEYDETGLQTRSAAKDVEADGSERNMTAVITWTKGADGKPVSFRCDLTADGEEPWTCTGDVTLDESGLIAWIGNVVVNGEMSSATATIERAKIDNPLPNAYEGWRSFDITGLIIPE